MPRAARIRSPCPITDTIPALRATLRRARGRRRDRRDRRASPAASSSAATPASSASRRCRPATAAASRPWSRSPPSARSRCSAWKELVDLGDHVFVAGEVISSRRGELSIMVVGVGDRREGDPAAAEHVLRAQRGEPRAQPLPRPHRARPRARDGARAREGQRQPARRPSPRAASSRSRPRCCRCSTAAHPLARSSRTRTRSTPTCTCASRPSCSSSAPSSAGIDRVFEINRNFRNEGADSTHSPEFAMLEAYEAYSDYNGIADLTQELIQNAAIAVAGSTTRDVGRRHRVRPRRRVGPPLDVRLAVGGSRAPRSRPQTLARRAAARSPPTQGVEVPPHATHGKLVEELWEHFVKGGLDAPDVRAWTSRSTPARSCASTARSPGVVEKWDLYVRGFELATGYSELVDPVIQRERFIEQAKLAARGDVEAMRIDEEFLRALEHGMPPVGRHGDGHRPAADGDHRARHPRDDPLPARQVAPLTRPAASGRRPAGAAVGTPSRADARRARTTARSRRARARARCRTPASA